MSAAHEAATGFARTENDALAYATSQPCASDNDRNGARVDLFFHSVRGIHRRKLYGLVKDSAQEDLLDTLKIMFYVRDIRGEGKGERTVFLEMYRILSELGYERAVLQNLQHVPFYGSWLDVCQLARSGFNETSTAALQLLGNAVLSTWKKHLNNEQCGSDALVVKWAPSAGRSLDKRYGLAKRLKRHLGWSSEEYRKRLSKMRSNCVFVVERSMCSGQWQSIEYSKIPGQAMKRYKLAFAAHDRERFSEFQSQAKRNAMEGNSGSEGAAKVNTAALLPHEIYRQMRRSQGEEDLLEAQWTTKLNSVREKFGDKLSGTLCVADVSGSMEGLPMDVSVSLSLFLSQLVQGPFAGRIITFSQTPTFHIVGPGSSLRQSLEEIQAMDWGFTTDLTAVFEVILRSALMFNARPDQMPNRIIIFSDMEFDEAVSVSMTGAAHIVGTVFHETTSYEEIRAKYSDAGYKMPQVVFWNLRSSSATRHVPVKSNQLDVALLSGFSPSSLNAVLSCEDLPTPWSIMRDAIRSERYDRIVLVGERRRAEACEQCDGQ